MIRPLTNRSLLFMALAAATVSACDGGTRAPLPPAGQGIAIEVSPADAQVEAAGTVKFAAVVTGTIDTTVSWNVVETAGGSVDTTGLYFAPRSGGTFHVRASSNADPSRIATAAVTVTPPAAVGIAVAPTTSAVDACRTLTFTATVTNATDTSVTWSVQEGAEGGSITAGGVYTAPSTAGTYHVVAQSGADPTRTAVAEVVVADHVLSVTVTPQQITVAAGGTAQFTASVTTTCGTVASVQTITADGEIVEN
jgi:hypothetical protein